ncbi:MAG TPA: helix-turn-helix transcriptional regulator, partial [Chitinophaga sp.]
PSPKPVTYSRRDFFKISLIEGHSKIHYADQCIEVQDNALVFTNPMIPYSWERVSAMQRGYVCIFTEDFFNRAEDIKHYPVFHHPNRSIMPLTRAEAAQYHELFGKMYNELQGNYLYKYDLLRNLLMEVVHAAQKLQPASGTPLTGSNAAERTFALFTELLERQFPVEMNNQVIRLKTPSDFARQLHLHVNHLNKALKGFTGQTTSQLISERILQEARILLKRTNWTINEIAWCLGFGEPNHFTTFFKHRAGIPPGKFRQAGDD